MSLPDEMILNEDTATFLKAVDPQAQIFQFIALFTAMGFKHMEVYGPAEGWSKQAICPGASWQVAVFAAGMRADDGGIGMFPHVLEQPNHSIVNPLYVYPINGREPSDIHPSTSVDYFFDAEGKFLYSHIDA